MADNKTLDSLQREIARFDQDRAWDGFYPLELLLNVNEEVAEVWQRMAWVDSEKKKQLAHTHRAELQNDVGDLLFLILKLANQLGVDAEGGLRSVLDEYEQRFPVERVRGTTANKTLGFDGKDHSL